MQNANELLNAGIAAVRAGNRDEGRKLLQAALRADPNSEQAWLWLSGVVDDVRQQRDCLQRVLALNPQNMAAKRGLERLAAQEAANFMADFNVGAKPAPPPPPPAAPSATGPTVNLSQTATGPTVNLSQQAAPPAGTGQDDDFDVDASLAALGIENKPRPKSKSEMIELPPSGVPLHATLPPPLLAPCYFCGSENVTEVCSACSMQQSYDCPSCGVPIDLRKSEVCVCQTSLRPYLRSGGLDHERLGDQYAAQRFTAAAIKQWEAAIPLAKNPQALHKKLANAYREVGLIARAQQHMDAMRRR